MALSYSSCLLPYCTVSLIVIVLQDGQKLFTLQEERKQFYVSLLLYSHIKLIHDDNTTFAGGVSSPCRKSVL